MTECLDVLSTIAPITKKLPITQGAPQPQNIRALDLGVQRLFTEAVYEKEGWLSRIMNPLLEKTGLDRVPATMMIKDLAYPKDDIDRKYLYKSWMGEVGENFAKFLETHLPSLEEADAENVRHIITGIRENDILLKLKLILHNTRARMDRWGIDERTQQLAIENLLWNGLKDIDAQRPLAEKYASIFPIRADAFKYYGLREFVRSGSSLEYALGKCFG